MPGDSDAGQTAAGADPELARQLTAYDAAYAARAEVLGQPPVTGNRRLAAVPGISAPVEIP